MCRSILFPVVPPSTPSWPGRHSCISASHCSWRRFHGCVCRSTSLRWSLFRGASVQLAVLCSLSTCVHGQPRGAGGAAEGPACNRAGGSPSFSSRSDCAPAPAPSLLCFDCQVDLIMKWMSLKSFAQIHLFLSVDLACSSCSAPGLPAALKLLPTFSPPLTLSLLFSTRLGRTSMTRRSGWATVFAVS